MQLRQLTADELAYLNELAADITVNGGCDESTVVQAINDAHKRRQAFATEMLLLKSKRSLIARKYLQTSVWNSFRALDTKQRLAMQTKNSIDHLFRLCDEIDSK